MESALELLVARTRHEGYKEAESIQNQHIDDLEHLLDKEEGERRALQEESKRMGRKVRGIVREKMERVLQQRGEKRGGEGPGGDGEGIEIRR